MVISKDAKFSKPILHIAIFRRSEFSCFIPTNVKAD
jgi:hypothetical protein